MQLYLIRHGESHVNRDGWATLPSMDAGLTEKGQQQAAALRDWLRDHAVQADVLYSSTMRRTRETAAYVSEALGLDIVFDDRIREIGNNHTAGLPVDESRLPRTFNPQWADVAPFAPRTAEFDDAESWVHLRVRLAQFVDNLAEQHPQQVIYVVTHGGVIAAMFDNVFNVGPYRRCDVHNVNSSWTLFEYRTDNGREPWLLRHHNRIDHLVGTTLL
jgi:broad specificity phosphatase PhoE